VLHKHVLMFKRKNLSKRDKNIIIGWILVVVFPMFVYAFVNTKFLPINEETFIGAWIGSLMGIMAMKGFDLLTAK